MVNVKKYLALLVTICSLSGVVYGELTWSTPVSISDVGVNASDPRVVIDSGGNATAVWIETNTVKASSLPFGGSWTTPATLSNVANTSSSPRLGIDSTGNVTALWIENSVIESATLAFGSSTWSAETAPISGSGASNPALAVDPSGNAVAVWVRSGFIESSTRITGTWNLVSVLSTSSSDNPHVAISSFGTAIAAWHSVISGADAIITDTLTISSNTWAATKNVIPFTAAIFHNYPKVALDELGNATIAWFRYNLLGPNAFENVQVTTSTLTQGAAAWAIPTFVSNSGIRNPADLTIKVRVDDHGDALVTWINSFDGYTFVIESAQKLFGGPWLPFVDEASSIYTLGMDVAAAGENALMTTMVWDGTSLTIQSQESDMVQPVQSGWTPPQTFSTGTDNGFPVCALSETASETTFNAVSIWLQNNGTNTVLNASTGTEQAIAPPTAVSATQNSTNLGVYTDFFNTITWTASTQPGVIQYNIYRNGVFFAAVGAGTTQFVDNNQVQGGTVTYGVAAMIQESTFRQSEIASFTLFP